MARGRVRRPPPAPSTAAPGAAPIVLNEWTARELGASVGDALSLEYYLWHEEGRIETRRADFRVLAIVPIAGAAADRELVPDYPGITHETRLADWDPPFAVDLSRIRPAGRGLLAALPDDAEGVAAARRGPGALGPPARAGRRRCGWRSPPRARRAPTPPRPSAASSPRASTPPRRAWSSTTSARARSRRRSGATDFGEYFVYFSFFLVVAALLLAGLFFRFGVEQRLAEVGLLRAVGFTEARLRRLFLGRGGAALGRRAPSSAWRGPSPTRG